MAEVAEDETKVPQDDSVVITKEIGDARMTIWDNDEDDPKSQSENDASRFSKFSSSRPYERSRSRSRSRSASPTSKGGINRAAICRDFTRSMCNRTKCRYYHPPDTEVKKRSWFTLCLDFQNGKCSRRDCRYFHLTFEDENIFRETGEISVHVIDQAMQKALALDVPSKSVKPTCKDFLRGCCKKSTCRYRHVTRREYEDEVYEALKAELQYQLGLHRGPRRRPPILPSAMGFTQRPMPPPGHADDMRPQMGPRMGGPPFSLLGAPMSRGEAPPPPPPMAPPFSGGMGGAGSGPPDMEFFRLDREKSDALERKLGGGPGSGGLMGPYGSGGGLAQANQQLKAELEKAEQRCEELLREAKARDGTTQALREAEAKLQAARRDLQAKVGAQEAELSRLKKELEARDQLHKQVQDQAAKLRDHLSYMEAQVSSGWGGVTSQHESWGHLRSLVMSFGQAASASLPPPATAYSANGYYTSSSAYDARSDYGAAAAAAAAASYSYPPGVAAESASYQTATLYSAPTDPSQVRGRLW